MFITRRKNLLFASTAIVALVSSAHMASAQSLTAADASDVETVIVTANHTVNSSVEIASVQAQKILPGIAPLKAIETLPGVVYETADPWGNNEQNESLIVHGFTTQQLGYTMDGVPLGDQQYGNYNGLSPSRAITSENVANVTLSSGAGSLGVASTSNLGGAIQTFSSDPSMTHNVDLRETLGSYSTTRTFLRVDTGDMGDNDAAYVSILHHDARAWDFDGHQKDDQVNAKFVRSDKTGKLTIYGDFGYKVEPNEDSDGFGNQQTAGVNYFPYTRPFLYPNLGKGLAYLTNGTPPAGVGTNFQNYHSAAQRLDGLAYIQYDWTIDDNMTWSNQLYGHHDTGRGIVAGPINQAGLPALFAAYYPGLIANNNTSDPVTLSNIVNVFGGTGYEARTTEYRINRGGERSTFNWHLGDHDIEAGVWMEYNASSTARRWYPFTAANNDQSPYDVPRNSAFTQYYVTMKTRDVQLHLQDQWHILPNLTLQAGIKASLQNAGNKVITQQVNLPTTNPPTVFPTGSITSNNWFLPQVGAVWDVTDEDQVFFNIQKNMRQYVPYAAGSNFYGASPWSLGSQAAFDQFKQTAHPETSWTYEGGIRSQRELDWGFLTSVSGQASYYHVNFSNRIFNVATYSFINPNPSILVNVGGVTTDGFDVAGTLNFGDHVHLYDAISFNQTTYDNSFSTVTGGVATIVPIAGKTEPLVPKWMNKMVASVNFGDFEAQVNTDFISRRFASYTDDQSVGSNFLTGLEASYNFDVADAGFGVKKFKLSGNITNLADIKGFSTVNVTGASGGFSAYPMAPRMFFVTVGTNF